MSSWDIVFKPENLAKFKDCGVHMLDSADDILPAALHYLGLDPNTTQQADLEKAADLAHQDQAERAQVQLVGISECARLRRDLPRGRLVRRHQAGAEARRRSQGRHRDRLRHPQGRRADVLRQLRDPEGRQERRRGACLHRLHAAAGRGGEELEFPRLCQRQSREPEAARQGRARRPHRLSGRRHDGELYTSSPRTTRKRSAADEPAVDQIKTGR